MTIWGNHSATQYPDLFHAKVDGKTAADLVDQDVDREDVHPDRAAARRGGDRSARRVVARRRPRTRRSTTCTTGRSAPPTGDWVSMAVCSDGSYGVPEGLISGFPCTTKDGVWSIVPGLDDRRASPAARIDASVGELGEERDAVAELGLI